MLLYDKVKQGSYKDAINKLAKKVDRGANIIYGLKYTSGKIPADTCVGFSTTFTDAGGDIKLLSCGFFYRNDDLMYCGTRVSENKAYVFLYNPTDSDISVTMTWYPVYILIGD